jgi:hypothetical protein
MFGAGGVRAQLEEERRLHAVTRQYYVDQLARADRAEAAAAELRAQVQQLTTHLVELKREGFAPPAKAEQLEPVGQEYPDLVQQAIRERAPRNSDLERDLLRWAGEQLRTEGADPSKIAQAILRGAFDEELEEVL